MTVSIPPIPHDTILASKSAFGNDNVYLKIGSGLAGIFSRMETRTLERNSIDQTETFWLYSLATALQFMENLTDRQMANATRIRVDFKYALHLPLVFPGLLPSTLCGFRQRLFQNIVERDGFQQVLDQLEEFVRSTGKTLANSEIILTGICMINRWETINETMSNAVEALAASHSGWLRSVALSHWYNRYSFNVIRNNGFHAFTDINASMLAVGKDGQHLLDEVEKSQIIPLMNLTEIQNLSQVWQCQFEWKSDRLDLRSQSCSNCIRRENSFPGVMGERRPIGEPFL